MHHPESTPGVSMSIGHHHSMLFAIHEQSVTVRLDWEITLSAWLSLRFLCIRQNRHIPASVPLKTPEDIVTLQGQSTMSRTARVFRNRPSPHSQPPLTREDREKRIKDAIDTWRGVKLKASYKQPSMVSSTYIPQRMQNNAKSKSELEDIATALSLSTEGTKSEILERIKGHLENTPDLRQDHRFSGLYHLVEIGHPMSQTVMLDLQELTILLPFKLHTPSHQLVPSISHGSMHSNGAPFSRVKRQQQMTVLYPSLPSFNNPPPAYPIPHPILGRETRFMQPVPAPEGLVLFELHKTSHTLHAGPSTGRSCLTPCMAFLHH
ncbi:uncharacterized protein EDB93DRAFT_1332657 [Suillus bovinus]|uniref:uncharacterized protein n=1 Tax=Suillus bovinus TaxID=48563 RepID=UPI001B86F011|nr:uncharacterized protein EDB93DRAFT_1332657 [Suillus bovinus]KAG2127606.1 hypothetical protein EDB93DRAFT_1332657 [Suillus bovinus]